MYVYVYVYACIYIYTPYIYSVANICRHNAKSNNVNQLFGDGLYHHLFCVKDWGDVKIYHKSLIASTYVYHIDWYIYIYICI